jgi:hypothetical protein
MAKPSGVVAMSPSARRPARTIKRARRQVASSGPARSATGADHKLGQYEITGSDVGGELPGVPGLDDELADHRG